VAFTTHLPRSPHIKVSLANHQHQDNTDIQQQLEQVILQKLQRITTGYETHINNMIQSLEVELELCIKTEKCLLRDISQLDNCNNSLLLSEKYRSKSNITKQCFDTNYQLVQRLLLGPSTVDSTSDLLQNIQFATSTSDNSQDLMLGNGGVTNTKQKEIDGYDTAQQVIHHTSRDWTSGSKSCREATNGWIVNALVENISTTISSSSSTIDRRELRVLVPGAGLGRLAYDIATSTKLHDYGVDVHVEANDSSVTMAYATQSVLEIISSSQQQQQKKQQYVIYPFISDPTRNEVDSKKRFEYEMFPDNDALDSYQRYYYGSSSDNNNNTNEDTANTNTLLPNLSYTVGDFVSTYSQHIKQSQYDIITTSFFLDTATNIYEYIMIMKHLLKQQSSSLWINCGPVQWHPCALLHPTVDELYDMLVVCGFELISWEVDDNEVVAYRHPDDCSSVMEGGEGAAARYTRAEGYRPLRFIARLVNDGDDNDDDDDDLPLRIEYCEYLNNVANGGGGGSV